MNGSRLDRSLCYLPREHVFDCPTCGQSHVRQDQQRDYQSIKMASEPVMFGED
jgi:glutamine amidotransferase